MATVGGRTQSRSRIVEEYVPSSGWTEDAKADYLLIDLPEFNKDEVKLQIIDSSGRHITVSGERKVNEDKIIYFEQTYELPENSEVHLITGKFDGEFLYITVPKQAVLEDEERPEHEIVRESQENEHEQSAINDDNLSRDDHRHRHLSQENEHEKSAINDENLSRDDRHRQHGNYIHGGSQSEEEKKRKGKSSHMGYPEETVKKREINESIISLTSVIVNMLIRNKGIVVTAILSFSLGLWVSR